MKRAWAMVLCASLAAVGARQSALGAQPEDAGTISGRVDIVTSPARRLATAGLYPGRTVAVQADRDVSEIDNVLVFLDMPERVPSAPRHAAIRQTNEEFVPHVVGLTVGSSVEFPNDDVIFHNVFSLSRAATFDLGRYPQHVSKTRTFGTPGIVKVFCHLHSHMSAVVRVFAHPYFAAPNRDGRFVIPGVPIGRHRVTAWHERAGEVTHEAAVDERGRAELSFSLPIAESP